MIAATLELLQGPAQSVSTPVIIQEWIGTVFMGLATLLLGGIVLAAICGACAGIYSNWKDSRREKKMRGLVEQMERAAMLDRRERDLLEREKEVK